MPKVMFTTDFTPKGQSPDIPTYKAGEIYDLERSYAEKYKRLGLAVDFDPKAAREREQQQRRVEADRKAAEEAAVLAAKLEGRGKILIPADLSILDWPALRDLAQSLSDEEIKSKNDAYKAIEVEKARRSAT